jgi:thiol-disulfide isomerase/thioredoxin
LDWQASSVFAFSGEEAMFPAPIRVGRLPGLGFIRVELLMRVRSSRRYLLVALAAALWSGLLVSGCSQDDGAARIGEVSPFDPKPPGSEKASLTDGIPLPGAPASKGRAPDDPLAGLTEPGKSALDTSFGANDVEKALRLAMSTAQKGDKATAIQILDQVLAVQPTNREALMARGAGGIELWREAKTPEARAAAIEKSVEIARALRRAHEALKAVEIEFFGVVLYTYSQHLAELKRFDDAVKALDESSDAGFDPYFVVELDEKMAGLKKTPQFQAALKAHDAARLVAAKDRVGARLAKPADIKFGFTLKDADNKPVSLSDFKGKVVLVDFWGTWCGPCRQTIPALSALYQNRKAKGLEIIGIDCERDIKEEAKVRENLVAFIKATNMPYRNVLGDDATIQQIPGFKGFPTTVILDRAGRVRALFLENDASTPEVIRDVVEVLLDEPVPPPVTEPAKKTKS